MPSASDEALTVTGHPYLTRANCEEFLKGYGAEHPETKLVLKTRLGDIKIRLYEETPLHRASFLYLIERGYFDQNCFYRVVPGFMIQGGNTDSDDKELLRSQIGSYKMPHEIQPENYHKRGALAAAREYKNNPDKLTNPYNFYIVHAQPLSEAYLQQVESEYDIDIPADQWQDYLKRGGTPHLDSQHTVFGEVYEGFEVIDAIAVVECDDIDWPINDVFLTVEILE